MRPVTVTVDPSKADGDDATSDAVRAAASSTDSPYVRTVPPGSDDGSD
jgi:hypothetical protein